MPANVEGRRWLLQHSSLPHMAGHMLQCCGAAHNLVQVVSHSGDIGEALDLTVSAAPDVLRAGMAVA